MQDVQGAGLTVDYEPPYETKDVATALSFVSVAISVSGDLPSLVDRV